MTPQDAPVCNFTYHLAGKPGEGELPCFRNEEQGTITSYWRPDEKDEVIDGDAIFIHIAGPITQVRVGLSNASCLIHQGRDLVLERWTEGDGGMIGAAHFKTEIVQHFVDGGYFYISQKQIPPYPTAVWIEKAPEGVRWDDE